VPTARALLGDSLNHALQHLVRSAMLVP
jgi:hypothetical protein